MTVGEIVLLFFLWGVPLGLVLRASGRYLQLRSSSSRDPREVRFAIALLWLTLFFWIAAGSLVMVSEQTPLPVALLNTALLLRSKLNVGVLFLLNAPIIVGALVLSALNRRSFPETLAVKKSVSIASFVLLAEWFLLAMNPH